MSGDIFDTLREKRFAEIEVCPDKLRGTIIKLKPVDGECIEVEAEVACIAENVKRVALAKGTDAEIPLTLKKVVLSKVLEYMKYHQTAPVGDILVPLASDNLVECGATKFDANFVNVDKNTLYDLMYAASAMHIPTLTYLTAVKATAMLMKKSTDEVRKETGLKNDLPVREEADIKTSFEELRTSQALEPGDTGIAPSVAMMHGVLSAAARQGALEPAEEGPPVPSRQSLNSWRLVSWRTAIFEDWTQLQKAPPDVCGDRELMWAAILASQGQALRYATETLRADPQLILHAAEVNGESMVEAAPELRGDRDFVLEAASKMGTAVIGATDALRGDRGFVKAAVGRGGGAALKGALQALREDSLFVLDCAAIAPEALLHAGEDLKASRDFALAAAGTIPGALQFLPAKYRADREVVDAAVNFDAMSLGAAHAARRQDYLGPETAAIGDNQTVLEHTGPLHVGVPNTLAAQEAGMWYSNHKLQKYVVFTAMSTITPNMGQSNYIAANSFLDKIAPYERPEIDAVGLMWGTVGGMGMRWKAFASMDFMNQSPDLLMGIGDAAKVLHMVTTRMDTPEWFAANYMDAAVRQAIVEGAMKTGGYRPSEDARSPSFPQGPMGPISGRSAEGFGVKACRGGYGEGPEGERRKFAWRPDPNAPLANWPGMSGTEEGSILASARVGGADKETVLELAREPREILEGSKVLLTGLNSKSGLTGTVVTCYPEGRYRVALDQKKGYALLRAEYLEVLDYVEN